MPSAKPNPRKWVRLGKVGKTYRLDGSFFVSERDEPIPKTVKWAILSDNPDDSLEKFKIKFSRKQSSRVIANLDTIDTATKIEAFKGLGIWTQRDQISVQNSKEYLWADITGKQIFDSDGTLLGTVIEVMNYGASDLVEILGKDQKKLMLPFTDYYFDMQFDPNDDFLHLVVNKEIFEEFWQ